MAQGIPGNKQASILFVDAYDSFSENIIALLRQLLHARVVCIKVDESIAFTQDRDQEQHHPISSFDAIVIGPGPGSPDSTSDTGYLDQIWTNATTFRIPVLGICLGFQSLCSRFGLPVTQLDLPCHGHARQIFHGGQDLFEGIGDVVATCYNSLGVSLTQSTGTSTPSSLTSGMGSDSQPCSSSSSFASNDKTLSGPVDGYSPSECSLEVLAWSEENHLMAVKHTQLPFWGLQFHPESCLSNVACQILLSTWWKMVQLHNSRHRILRNVLVRDQSQDTSRDNSASATGLSALSQRLDELTRHCTQKVSFSCCDATIRRKQLADLCQAMSAEQAVAMLESSRRGRFSIYAFTDQQTWMIRQVRESCLVGCKENEQHSFSSSINATMEAMEAFMLRCLATGGESCVPFWGGLVGFLSYEAGHDLLTSKQRSNDTPNRPRNVPDLSLMWVDRSVVLDNETGRSYIQTLRINDDEWVSDMKIKLEKLAAIPTTDLRSTVADFDIQASMTITPTQSDYISRIRSCLGHLHAGNSYELCLTTSAKVINFSPELSGCYKLYRSLQDHNPASYSAYLLLNTTAVLSSSPEQFLSWSRSTPYFDMMPMKGTLAKSPNLTRQQASETLRTPKEEAENLMIADLIRHDLHRSLAPHGTVEVKSLYEVVETENTYQLISHIRGHIPGSQVLSSLSPTLQQPSSSAQIMHYGHKALRISLPPGSMTGAPKIRSCSILSQLEQRNRGVYSGVIGYFDIGGGGCWSVAIRCAFSDESEDEVTDRQTKKTWHVGAGGAITVLSDEEKEWEEMRVKMDGVLKGFRTGVDGSTTV